MAVRPENRYESARQLADDIEHWLADEPISAQPDTRTQLVARRIRRHRSLALAIAIALLLITLVSTVATLLVNYQRQLADTAKGQAETGFREARGAVDDLFTKVSDTTLLNQPGAQELRKQLLEKTLVYYKRFIDERADDPTLQDELGVTYFHVGRIEEEMASPEKGLAYYLQAQQIQVRLVAKSPSDSQRLNALGDTFNAIGGALKKGHRLDDALKAFGQAREMRQELAVLTPQNAGYALALANAKMNVGLVERMLNRPDDALDEEKQAQQIRRAHLSDSPDKSKLEKDMAMGSYNLGVLELGLKRVKDAQKDFAESIGLFKQLNIRDQHDLTIQKLLATCYRLQGVSLSQSSPDLAVHSYQQARDAFATLVDRNPDVSDYKSELAEVYMSIGDAQRGSDSIAAFEQARQILEDLAQKFPDNPKNSRDLALTLQSLADRQIKTGKFEPARINLEKSLALLTRLNQRFPNDPDIIQKLAEGRAALRQMDERKPVPPPSAPTPPQKSPASPSSSSS
jgi:serine/threonine-protein kinase